MDLQAVNLNLLAAFAALVDEGSVTRAARRMGVTQSAMSSSLGQLRALFDDPLFRRTSHGIEPTPRALELATLVRPGLALLSRALQPPRFDPRTAERTFVIAASDYVELVLLPALLRRIAREAPKVRVRVQPWGLHDVPPTLANGRADVAVGYYDEIDAHHRHRVLFEETFTCIVRRGHPRVGDKLTLSTWLALEHVMVSQKQEGPGTVDKALAARGLQRTVGARVSHFLIAPVLVARTDMVAAIDRGVAETFAKALELRMFDPPIPLPGGKMGLVWHEQLDNDPAEQWFRGAIEATVASDLTRSVATPRTSARTRG